MLGPVEKTYQKVSQIEHVLMRPEVYIGSIQETKETLWIVEDQAMVQKNITYVPGLYKIFDQILVNAADNYQRDKKMSRIEVQIKREEVTVTNDGQPIPVQIHKQHGVYVPELIFGHLLTSSNYHDNQKKVTGGRNGYGAKLTNLFSTYFEVQTADSGSGKLCTLKWSSNMAKKEQPLIQPYSGSDYTTVTFRPDFGRFGLARFSPDMIGLMKRRVYDLAGILKVKVFLNNKLVPISGFKQYVRLYLNEQEELISEASTRNGRWQVQVCRSEGEHVQVSFVNAIATTRGGTHVAYILDQVTEKIIGALSKKKGPAIKPSQVKTHLKVFVNCLIDNPSFSSQTKDSLTTPAKDFGSTCLISDEFVKELLKSGIGESILRDIKVKENNRIDRELKRVKKTRLIIPKLEDANEAGRSSKCCLILTEGDSAKALALCGLEELGRDYFGVFPLKGKPANVKTMTPKQVMENAELSNIVKILGLTFGKEYSDVSSLRYGSVMIMADQDNDGSHIKGLVINFLETFWPSLCRLEGFLKQFITPIIKASRSGSVVSFYSQVEFNKWREDNPSGWSIKYYKGLGTSTSRQAKQYFTHLPQHEIRLSCRSPEDHQCLSLAFDKDKADLRKEWLQNYNPEVGIDHRVKQITVQDFVNRELIHFSISDNVRSIPSLMDGLKPSQRKILFACFKRNLVQQMKVAQLAGYVAEHSAYHHGEMSLCSTIVGMAQDFPGSNNLNLLLPLGQFGTRYENGKDSASSRYIFTKLNPLTRYLFKEEDDHILDYQEEENQTIEPHYYLPILPVVLINGAQGIGTGWSTTVLPHRVTDVITLLKDRIEGRESEIEIGWHNFGGSVERDPVRGGFIVTGALDVQDHTVTIRQIPLNKSIHDYKSFLEEKLESANNNDPELEELKEYHQNNSIEFVLRFLPGRMPPQEDMVKYLKLSTTHQLNNMHLFDPCRKIKKYGSVQQILEEFYKERLEGYKRRKAYLLSKFRREQNILDNQVKFIRAIIEGTFKLVQSKQDWLHKLRLGGFTPYFQLSKVQSSKKREEDDSETADFNYLLTMPIWSFCQQKLNQLSSIEKELLTIVDHFSSITEQQMWLKDINDFQTAWLAQQEGKEVTQKKHRWNQNLAQNSQQKKRTRTTKIDTPQLETRHPRLSSLQNRTMMEQQIQRSHGRKRNKQESTLQDSCLSQRQEVLVQKKQEQHSGIESILSKYLTARDSSGGELALLDRIKARISGGDQTFKTSYSQAKEQLERPKRGSGVKEEGIGEVGEGEREEGEEGEGEEREEGEEDQENYHL